MVKFYGSNKQSWFSGTAGHQRLPLAFYKEHPNCKSICTKFYTGKKRPINEYTCFKGTCQGKFVLFVYGLVILSGEV